jgi:hypothetical protein
MVALAVLPDQIETLLNKLRHEHLSKLTGVVWSATFANQQPPAWDKQTWQALVKGKPVQYKISLVSTASNLPGTWDITVRNVGDLDAALPETVDLSNTCSLSEGQQGYSAWHDPQTGQVGLHRNRPATLSPKQSMVIGQANCRQVPQALVHAPEDQSKFN